MAKRVKKEVPRGAGWYRLCLPEEFLGIHYLEGFPEKDTAYVGPFTSFVACHADARLYYRERIRVLRLCLGEALAVKKPVGKPGVRRSRAKR
jgi:hypothetical protein